MATADTQPVTTFLQKFGRRLRCRVRGELCVRFGMLCQIAMRTSQTDIRRIVAPATRERNLVVNMVKVKRLMAVIALPLLNIKQRRDVNDAKFSRHSILNSRAVRILGGVLHMRSYRITCAVSTAVRRLLFRVSSDPLSVGFLTRRLMSLKASRVCSAPTLFAVRLLSIRCSPIVIELCKRLPDAARAYLAFNPIYESVDNCFHNYNIQPIEANCNA